MDSTIRVGLIDYVLERFKDWQLIIAGHDRAWLSQLRGLFAKHGRVFAERTIQRWSFDQGPVVAGAAQNRADSLTAALAASDVRQTAAGIGLLLEEICQELSWRVQASVTRREGDRYTLGDLWPGVVRAFRATSLKALLSEIDMGGSHHNIQSSLRRVADGRRGAMSRSLPKMCSACMLRSIANSAATGLQSTTRSKFADVEKGPWLRPIQISGQFDT